MIKIITIVGARPQFIKAAVVSRAIQRHNAKGRDPQINEVLVHTGQHYDYNMSGVFFEQLDIPAHNHNLGIGSGRHGRMTGKMLIQIEGVFLKERPDYVLVYGDTNSTLAGALAATKLHIPVVHVEAGLRSFNRRMPEEINRVLTDHIANMLFCPTATAVRNLEKEGITKGVFEVGDVMYDAFLAYKSLAQERSAILSQLGLTPLTYCLATVHRQENTDDIERLLNIFAAFAQLATAECQIILPLHPRTQKALENGNASPLSNPHVRLIDPVSYLDLIALESQAKAIFTDSGGVQKEAYFAKVPCVTLRDETEWIETVEAGWNHLGGANTQKIMKAFQEAADSSPNEQPNFYGNGEAAKLIVKHLISASHNGQR